MVPHERMPNGFSGILLGQIGVKDSLEYRAIPRSIIEATGAVLEDNIWGELVLHNLFDADTGEVMITLSPPLFGCLFTSYCI